MAEGTLERAGPAGWTQRLGVQRGFKWPSIVRFAEGKLDFDLAWRGTKDGR